MLLTYRIFFVERHGSSHEAGKQFVMQGSGGTDDYPTEDGSPEKCQQYKCNEEGQVDIEGETARVGGSTDHDSATWGYVDCHVTH